MSNLAAGLALTEDVPEDEVDNQFVTFQVADEIFGLPMVRVLEIIRFPDTVPVPLTPAALVGLANLRGSVLPVIDLRRLLQLPASGFNDMTRVVVTEIGIPVGLVVDRVLKVIRVEVEQIEASDRIQTTIDVDLLAGVIKPGDGQPLIQLLELEALVRQEFPPMATETVSGGEGARQPAETPSAMDPEDDIDQLVSFLVEDQEYAFALAEVEEIVRMPESIAKVPQADDHVLGLIDLRGRLLPLVSLRRLFVLGEVPWDEDHRIVVVGLRQPGGGKVSIGLVVDEVREVLRVPKEVQDATPDLLALDDEETISCICRLDGGERLVSVLCAESLFRHPIVQAALDAWESEGGNEVNEVDLRTEVDVEDDDTAQLVVFRLGDQEYGVSIDTVQEITQMPERLEKVPKTADFIEGMVNLRGTVLPVLDMRVRFGMPRMPANDHQRIVVLNLDGVRTGFIVDAVVEVLRLPRERIESAPRLSEDQSRIMGQVVNLKEQQRLIQVLTARELLSEKEWATIQEQEEEK